MSEAPLPGNESAAHEFPREELRKLEWRCRRGMKELDLLLVRYLRNRYSQASAAERDAFERFLELPDPEIARYLVRGATPEDPTEAALCRALLSD